MTRRFLAWQSPSGTFTTLDTTFGDVSLGRNFSINGLPQVRTRATVTPGRPGAQVQSVVHGTREVTIPVVFQDLVYSDLETKVDAFARLIDPTKGDGQLVVIRHDGSMRFLRCRYKAGLQIVEQLSAMPAWVAVCVFEAHDPYFYAGDLSQVVAMSVSGTAPAFFPMFPLSLGQSEGIEVVAAVNGGDVPTPPTFTLYGPAVGLKVTNLTTGRAFELSVDVPAGGTLTVDCAARTATDSTGANVLPRLLVGSDLFDLSPGSNSIEATVTGTAPSTRMIVNWRNRWLTA